MELQIDESRFDDRQNRFVGVILREVVKVLGAELDIDKSDAVSAGKAVTFALASLLDGSRSLSGKNRDLVPHLTFAHGKRRQSLITSESGSWMHEYVHGWSTEMFSQFESPVILHRDLPKIPLRTQAALAWRSLRRALQTLDRIFGRSFSGRHAELVESVSDALLAISMSDEHVENPRELMSATVQEFESVLNDLRPGSPERSAFLSAMEGARIGSQTMVNDVLSFAASVGFELKAAKRDRLERALCWPAYLDFKLVESRLEVGKLTASSPCDPDSLGALWLKHEPDWASYP
ncbi:MAG TPA: hypothetical protein PKD64_19965 [Pirellulaceae bacterium]|nr:hypothetical protein [Pirellulaceae bacterium]HMO94466.1 hypothetical protein [Pirellulaceae bacterium]